MQKPVHFLAVLALLSGCATPRMDAISPGSRITIEAEANRSGEPYPVEITIANRNIGKAAGIGASTGAVIGVLGSIACGPLFFACATIIGGATMGVGALAGVVAGSASGLPAEVEAAIGEKTRVYGTGDRVRAELVSAVKEKLQGRWTVVDADASTRILLRVDQVTLDVDAEHRISLAMRTTMTIERMDRNPRGPPESRMLSYQGVSHHPQLWSEDRDGFIGESLRTATAHIANAVFAELAR